MKIVFAVLAFVVAALAQDAALKPAYQKPVSPCLLTQGRDCYVRLSRHGRDFFLKYSLDDKQKTMSLVEELDCSKPNGTDATGKPVFKSSKVPGLSTSCLK